MDSDLRLEFCSDPRLLVCVRSTVKSWLEARGCAADTLHELVLAIDEACSNAIRHSYGGSREHVVRLDLVVSPEFLEVRLCDEGVPCPSAGLERRDIEAPDPETVRPGGLGVQLMHRAFDEVEFCPGRETGNCVILRKRRKA